MAASILLKPLNSAPANRPPQALPAYCWLTYSNFVTMFLDKNHPAPMLKRLISRLSVALSRVLPCTELEFFHVF